MWHELKVQVLRVRRQLAIFEQQTIKRPSESEAVVEWVGSGLRMIPISLFRLFSALTLASRLAAVRGFHLEEIEREEGEEWNYSDKVGGPQLPKKILGV